MWLVQKRWLKWGSLSDITSCYWLKRLLAHYCIHPAHNSANAKSCFLAASACFWNRLKLLILTNTSSISNTVQGQAEQGLSDGSEGAVVYATSPVQPSYLLVHLVYIENLHNERINSPFILNVFGGPKNLPRVLL